jgi:hypothetical protein
MKSMSSKEIKDRYGAFTEAARRETVVHTSHGRPTLLTNSIDRARAIPELREELGGTGGTDRKEQLARILAMAGVGESIVGKQSASRLRARSRFFRGSTSG